MKQILRRAKLDEEVKKQIHQRVVELMKEKHGDPEQDGSDSSEESEDASSGMVYLFDASDHSRGRVAMEFDTRKEYETYRKTHKVDPSTKIIILEEKKNRPKQEIHEKRGPAEKEVPNKKVVKKEEPSNKQVVKKEEPAKKVEKKEEPKEKQVIKKEEPEEQKPEKKEEPKYQKVEKPSGDKPSGEKEERKPGEPLSVNHPVRIENDLKRQIAIKDSLIEEFGAEAKDWSVHKVFPKQLFPTVVIKFPDGTSKQYGQLSDDEKKRVEKAMADGLAASKGLADYTDVSASTLRSNMNASLSRYDNADIEEPKNDSNEPATKENVLKFSESLRENGKKILEKYKGITSRYSRDLTNTYINDFSDTVEEAVRDGSLGDIEQSKIDSFMKEGIKRLLHQEIETRGRSLGDHGIRHVVGNCKSSMQMMKELQTSGIKITGKHKMMALATMVDHDIGYTVGDVGVDITKGKKHKEYSKQIVDQERERMDTIFGKEDGDKVRMMIATHDDPIFDWENDPVASTVRLADNTALFGVDKVQDLFLRSPKATELACKLLLSAQAKPDDKKMQENIKAQLHEVVDGGEFEDADRELMHNQIDEMSEKDEQGKGFSTSKDILSRFSGKLNGFKFDRESKSMNVNMQYSSEGQMVDKLFGDDVACFQFGKFVKDMNGEPVDGDKSKTVFKDDKGKEVFRMNMEGFDSDDEPATAAMRDFAKKTARTELRKASMYLYPPPTDVSKKDVGKAKKALKAGKEKFTDEEWKKLMEEFEKADGDPVALSNKLGMWPLLQSEFAFLGSKMASSRIVRRIALSMLSDRVAYDFLSSRGQQTQRKDKDLMSDTGGISKNRQRDPLIKPPRSDSHNRYRTKDKTPDQRDPDVDKKAKTASSIHPLDVKVQGSFCAIPEENYHRQVLSRLVGIMQDANGVSEKAFSAMDELMKTAEGMVRSQKGEEIVKTFHGVGSRPAMCAEGMYFEMVQRGKTASSRSRTASDGFASLARQWLSRFPRTLIEAIMRA